ncbi:MAG: hypothetical protein QGG36_04335 [Pirellulaceae bacterium]|jgi:hypothetical protein|nr:hypothetical protein [Pirellulaceae bacterium]MDP7014998.1 hypothetical protein [Pirellulaceae bacterium]
MKGPITMEEIQRIIRALRVDAQLQRILRELGLDPLILANEIEDSTPSIANSDEADGGTDGLPAKCILNDRNKE